MEKKLKHPSNGELPDTARPVLVFFKGASYPVIGSWNPPILGRECGMWCLHRNEAKYIQSVGRGASWIFEDPSKILYWAECPQIQDFKI